MACLLPAGLLRHPNRPGSHSTSYSEVVGGFSVNSPQSDELKDFLLSRQQHASTNEISWGERRREWINAVERLYQTVTDELLSESIAQGLVAVSRVEKEITEEYLGTYRVPELILDIGAETVRFSPKGRNTIGANGRVDLVGELDAMTLVLEPAGHWSVVLSRLPRQVVALDGKALTEALRRVMR
jgi:hypothetical protein